MLEAYQAYADYITMLDLTRELIQAAAIAANGEAVVRWPGADGTVHGGRHQRRLAGTHGQRRDLARARRARSPPTPTIEELRKLCDSADDRRRSEVEPWRRRRWKCTSASSST